MRRAVLAVFAALMLVLALASSAPAAPTDAPVMSVTGQTVSWPLVDGIVSRYVFVRKVPGSADQYYYVNCTSNPCLHTPAAAPGQTVNYGGRTDVAGSAWAREVQITYQNTTDAPVLSVRGTTIYWDRVAGVTQYKGAVKVPGQATVYPTLTCTTDPCQWTPAEVPDTTVNYGMRTDVTGSAWATEVQIVYAPQWTDADRQVAPVYTVSNGVVSWNRVADVDSYVFVTKVPGQADRYETVACCSINPPDWPGQTVNYGGRTNVTGSAWGREVQITYAGAPPSGLALSVNGPGDWLAFMHATALATHPASFRLDASRMSTTSAKDAAVNQARADGVRPEIVYVSRSTSPSSIRADALRYGPNATSNLPLLYVEFGNEDSYSYKNASANTARQYGDQVEAVANALVGTGVRVIAQADDANINSTTNWVANMYSTFPNMDSHTGVGGWVIHPYGPGYMTRINRLVSQTTAQGAPANFPVFITEYGLSSDNGRCLSDNYGWDRCMTYTEAGQTITSVYNDIDANAPAVTEMFIYNAGDGALPGVSTDRELYFGELKRDMTSKPGYTNVLNTLGG